MDAIKEERDLIDNLEFDLLRGKNVLIDICKGAYPQVEMLMEGIVKVLAQRTGSIISSTHYSSMKKFVMDNGNIYLKRGSEYKKLNRVLFVNYNITTRDSIFSPKLGNMIAFVDTEKHDKNKEHSNSIDTAASENNFEPHQFYLEDCDRCRKTIIESDVFHKPQE